MYLTASLEQPLHYAGEVRGLTSLGHGPNGHGGRGMGKKRMAWFMRTTLYSAAHRRTISHDYCTFGIAAEAPPRIYAHYSYIHAVYCIAPFHA